jgi:uncharacterized protein YajQ (UPF0234 family)
MAVGTVAGTRLYSLAFLKDRKLKRFRAAVRADQARMSSPSSDVRRGAIGVLREHDLGVALQLVTLEAN